MAPSKLSDTLRQWTDRQQENMVANTIELAEINSGSYHPEGIARVQKKLQTLFAPLADSCETISLQTIETIDNKGDKQTFQPPPMQTFRHNSEAPLQLLLTGHSDTVFSPSDNFQHCDIRADRLHGPGCADMKGGLIIMRSALYAARQALGNIGLDDELLGYTIALSPDEEIGSVASASVLHNLAKQADYGLTFEPALSDGTLAGARKGSGNFTLCCRGKSSHAGREFFSGNNAINALLIACQQLAALSDKHQGITLNVGFIHGGGAVNIVPDFCQCKFNLRFERAEQQAELQQKIRHIISQTEQLTGCHFFLHGQITRPVKTLHSQQLMMYQLLQQCGKTMNIPVHWRATGGCCEGNNLAAAGLLNIDTLGVRGAHIHSDQEYACINSFSERSALVALFILTLLQQKLQQPALQQEFGQQAEKLGRLLC